MSFSGTPSSRAPTEFQLGRSSTAPSAALNIDGAPLSARRGGRSCPCSPPIPLCLPCHYLFLGDSPKQVQSSRALQDLVDKAGWIDPNFLHMDLTKTARHRRRSLTIDTSVPSDPKIMRAERRARIEALAGARAAAIAADVE